MENLVVVGGGASTKLALATAAKLNVPFLAPEVGSFPDGETWLHLDDGALHGMNVLVIWSTAAKANDKLIELTFLLDTINRENPRSIIVAVPYFGYSRQDRQDKRGVPIAARVASDIITTQRFAHLILVDLHTPQMVGYFRRPPAHHLTAKHVMAEQVISLKLNKPVVVSPDIGGVKHAKAYAKMLGCDFAVADKQRLGVNEVITESLIGDVMGKDVLLVDDMCASGSTLVEAANLCRQKGARSISAAITHGVFTKGAAAKLKSGSFKHILVSDTLDSAGELGLPHLSVVSLDALLAETVLSLLGGRSIFGHFVG